MATEQANGYSDHFRSVTVTAIAAMAGVLAAVVSVIITQGVPPAQAAGNQKAQYVMLGFILMQPLALKVLGLLKEDFGLKDFLFIAFMTFSMWFVTWGILLTTAA